VTNLPGFKLKSSPTLLAASACLRVGLAPHRNAADRTVIATGTRSIERSTDPICGACNGGHLLQVRSRELAGRA